MTQSDYGSKNISIIAPCFVLRFRHMLHAQDTYQFLQTWTVYPTPQWVVSKLIFLEFSVAQVSSTWTSNDDNLGSGAYLCSSELNLPKLLLIICKFLWKFLFRADFFSGTEPILTIFSSILVHFDAGTYHTEVLKKIKIVYTRIKTAGGVFGTKLAITESFFMVNTQHQRFQVYRKSF